jgi:signal transduction histidine kinase
VSRRVARILAVAILVAAVASTATSVVFGTGVRDRVARGDVVVYGDLDAPGMREVLADLRARAAEGAPLIESLGGPYNPGFGAVVAVLLLWVGVGVFIVWRQPRNWAGWLFLITGAPLPLLTLVQALVIYGLKVEPGSIPFAGALAVIGEYALYPLALLPLLFLLYPDGRLPSRRWRWAAIGLVGGTTLAFLGFLFRPGPFNNYREDGILYENPLGIDAFGFGGAVIAVGTIVALVSGISTAVAVVQRFRRSTGEERQQMRLLAFVAATAGALLVTLFLTGFVGSLLGIGEEWGEAEEPPIFPILFGLTAFTIAFGIPAAYLVAILRYRLWNLDVVIRKAVIFALVAGTITILTLILALMVPVAFLGTGLSGWERALLGVGVAIGALVGPLRRWARRVADRLVFGRRATPYEVLTAFSERVGETYATEDVLPRMARILRDGTGADVARVYLRVGSELREVAASPEGASPDPNEFLLPVMHQGEDLGALAVTMPPNDPMDPSKERLIGDLGAQAGLVLRNVKLIEELRASRQRLVAAQDEERRKLERDLHDGAQQQLVALQVQLRLAEQLVGRNADKERELLHRLQGAAATALDDLRDLARGIYPPLLADQGLPAALEAQARKAPLPVRVDPDGVGRYAKEVEAAVYFCSLEALNNIAKYASATQANVRLSQRSDTLIFEVIDDGRGFDPDATVYGTGLQGMADRIDAIGGSLEVRSRPGAGTTIIGRVPLGDRR